MSKNYKITIDYGTHGSVVYGSFLLATWLKLRHGLFAEVEATPSTNQVREDTE